MMDQTLYERLSVDRSAGREEIKAAYRAMAKTHHPDAGGDPDVFRAISEAYRILSDDNAREIYDRTGNANVGEEALRDKEARVVIQEFVESVSVAPDLMFASDIIAAFDKKCDEGVSQSTTKCEQGRRAIAKLERFKKGLRYSGGGTDFVAEIADRKIAAIRSQIAINEGVAEVFKRAKSMLGQYRYDSGTSSFCSGRPSGASANSVTMSYTGIRGESDGRIR